MCVCVRAHASTHNTRGSAPVVIQLQNTRVAIVAMDRGRLPVHIAQRAVRVQVLLAALNDLLLLRGRLALLGSE